jgi:hypothetical protein
MRSGLFFGAAAYISNRYLLVKLASRAARKLHRPDIRIQDNGKSCLCAPRPGFCRHRFLSVISSEDHLNLKRDGK